MRNVEHIRLTDPSPATVGHSWCGLSLLSRASVIRSDYDARKAQGLTSNVCQNCIAALEKGTPRVVSGL